MQFTGFTIKDFEIFTIEGLGARMQAIREHLQPKFQCISHELLDEISMLSGHEMYLHIAKHMRRTVNPPKDTWMAFCHNKRGYKQHPHFQIGLFDDRVFLWLAFIYEMPNKKKVAGAFLNQIETISEIIPQDYLLAFDHTKKDAEKFGSFTKETLKTNLIRFRDVAKADLLIGKHIAADDLILREPDRFISLVKETFTQLMPIYLMSTEG